MRNSLQWAVGIIGFIPGELSWTREEPPGFAGRPLTWLGIRLPAKIDLKAGCFQAFTSILIVDIILYDGYIIFIEVVLTGKRVSRMFL